jgi:hypothetical protein
MELHGLKRKKMRKSFPSREAAWAEEEAWNMCWEAGVKVGK